MHYDPVLDDHGLPMGPFKSISVPRPIAWVSTISKDGIANLAPYSQYMNLTFDPPYIMLSINQTPEGNRKDTCNNIEQTGEFVINMPTYELREALNRTATQFPPDVDEFIEAGVTKAPSIKVKPYRIEECPIQLECVYHQTLRLPGAGAQGTCDVIIGKVVMIHIKDEVIAENGQIDIVKIRPLARLGYWNYTSVTDSFEMVIPNASKELLVGLQGAKQK